MAVRYSGKIFGNTAEEIRLKHNLTIDQLNKWQSSVEEVPSQVIDIILAYTPTNNYTPANWDVPNKTIVHPAYLDTVEISTYPDSNYVRYPFADYWSATYADPGTYAGHGGLDCFSTSHAPIYAVADGIVYEAYDDGGGSGLYGASSSGTYVAIRTNNCVGCTSTTTYKHLNSKTVSAGDAVSAGDQIGTQGTTGNSTGEHLHFDLFINMELHDPIPYILGAKAWAIGSSPSDLSVYALKANVLELANTAPFTPNADYEPATKKYVDDSVPASTVSDAAYDASWDGVTTLSPSKNAVYDKINSMTSALLLAVYPVGAIYTSVVSTSPATLFGGTWSAFAQGKVLVGIDSGDTDFDTVEETGGAKTHTLTTAELASHAHASLNSGFITYKTGTTDGITATSATYKANIDANTATAGSGNAHNNLQPYITVYMWKRIS